LLYDHPGATIFGLFVIILILFRYKFYSTILFSNAFKSFKSCCESQFVFVGCTGLVVGFLTTGFVVGLVVPVFVVHVEDDFVPVSQIIDPDFTNFSNESSQDNIFQDDTIFHVIVFQDWIFVMFFSRTEEILSITLSAPDGLIPR